MTFRDDLKTSANDWMDAESKVETAERALKNAREELQRARQHFGEKLDPGDMHPGERVSSWLDLDGDRPVMVEAEHDADGHWDMWVRGTRRAAAPKEDAPTKSLRWRLQSLLDDHTRRVRDAFDKARKATDDQGLKRFAEGADSVLKDLRALLK